LPRPGPSGENPGRIAVARAAFTLAQ